MRAEQFAVADRPRDSGVQAVAPLPREPAAEHCVRAAERVRIMMSSPKLLFIEPKQPASPVPVIDHVTRRMCAAFRQARVSDYAYGGVHICHCGAISSSSDYQ